MTIEYDRIEKKICLTLAFFSVLILSAIVALFTAEIFFRYVLNAPTTWSSDVIAFTMPAMIFFALPEVTRRKHHIAITFMLEMARNRNGAVLSRLVAFLSFTVSSMMGYITGLEAYGQYLKGIQTNSLFNIPKWLVSVPISVGFLACAIVFLATSLGVERADELD